MDTDTNIIKLDSSHKEQFRKLIKIAFPTEGDFEQEFDRILCDQESIWQGIYGILDQNILVSSIMSLPGMIKIRDQECPIKFIDAVATIPSHRKRNYITAMTNKEIMDNFNSEFVFLSLGPFKHSFYRRLGFEVATDSYRLTFDFDFLSRSLSPKKNYTLKMDYMHANEKLQADVLQVRDWCWQNSSYNEARIPQAYENIYYRKHTQIRVVVVYDEESVPQGYFFYFFKEEQLVIQSIRYCNLGAFYALKRYLLSFRDHIKSIEFCNLPHDFPVDLLVDNYWLTGKKFSLAENPWHMMRIINVQRALQRFASKIGNAKEPIFLKVNDDQIPQNYNIYRISSSDENLDAGQNLVITVSVSNETHYDAVISVSTLVPLLTGRKSAKELYLWGKIGLHAESEIANSKNAIPEIVGILDELFPKQETFYIG